jgi:sec-independent protein translocase protein TatA
MFGDLLQPMHLLLIALVVIVLFGAKKLPELGKGLGEGLRGFKSGLKGIEEEDSDEKKKREELEAKAYQEAKMAAEARVAAEARLAAEQKAQNEVVIK